MGKWQKVKQQSKIKRDKVQIIRKCSKCGHESPNGADLADHLKKAHNVTNDEKRFKRLSMSKK